MQLVSSDDARRIETHLSQVIDRYLDADALPALRECIRDYILTGGKRIRPQLVLWTYRLCSDAPLCDCVLNAACAWELFHAFLLVHDDIIDNASSRRDRQTLHCQLAELDGGSEALGTNLAIVAGDLLFSAAMCLWHEIELPDARANRDLLKLFSRVACTTGLGQAIDIWTSHLPVELVDSAALLREYHWKTAAYTFEGPMLSGAILGNLCERGRAAISRFALSLGQAYQLQNDLNDLATPAHAGCDLVQGKRTIVLMHYRERLDAPARRIFDARLDELASGSDEAISLAELLRQDLLSDERAICDSRATIDRLLMTASAAAADPSVNERLSIGMGQLLEELGRQYFVSPLAEVLCL